MFGLLFCILHLYSPIKMGFYVFVVVKEVRVGSFVFYIFVWIVFLCSIICVLQVR